MPHKVSLLFKYLKKKKLVTYSQDHKLRCQRKLADGFCLAGKMFFFKYFFISVDRGEGGMFISLPTKFWEAGFAFGAQR